jgi:hypothetical protein
MKTRSTPQKFMRSLMSLCGLVPIPSDALVTPVTFKVRKRKLRGILQDWDALEDGKRELTGEWVIGRRLWRKLQSEWQKNKVGKEKPPDHHKNSERIVLYVHGGLYQIPSSILLVVDRSFRCILHVRCNYTPSDKHSALKTCQRARVL